MDRNLGEKVYPHEISQRINTLIFRFCQGNKTLFSKKIGVSQQRINRLFNIDNRTNKYPKPSDDIIEAILSYYPEVDKVWLLTGDGGIINVKESNEGKNVISGNNHRINQGGIYNEENIPIDFIEIIRKKDEQIAQKDEQINKLLALLSNER